MKSISQQSVNKTQMLLIIFSAMFLPLVYTIFWMYQNSQLPVEDAANYLATAINLNSRFLDHGIVHGFGSIYLLRGWRPIFFPVLLVPFLWITQNKLLLAYSLFSISLVIASCVYVYLFLRLKLSRVAAIIGTNLIGLLPMFQSQMIMMFAEAGLFPCIFGSLYHLIKSDYFRNRNHTIGFVIVCTLGLLIRPIEMVTHLCLIAVLFVYSGYAKKIFSLQQIFLVMGLGLLSICIFMIAVSRPYYNFTVVHLIDDGGVFDTKMAGMIHQMFHLSFKLVFLTFFIFGVYFYKSLVNTVKRLSQSMANPSYFVPAFAAIFAITLIWFVPFAFETFQWIYRTSFGDVAFNTVSIKKSKYLLGVLHSQIKAEGQFIVLGSFLVAGLALLLFKNAERRKLIFSDPVVYLLLTIPLPLWEVIKTIQSTPRKLSAAFPAMIMAMLIIGLARGRGYGVRIFAAGGLLVVQFGLVLTLMYVNDYNTPNERLNSLLGYLIPQPTLVKPNPHDTLIAFLAEKAKAHNLHSIAIEVDPNPRVSSYANPVDPFLMSAMADAKRQNFAASYPYFSSYSADNLRILSERYDGLFLADNLEAMTSPDAVAIYSEKYANNKDASLKTFYEFLLRVAEKDTAKYGWEVDECFIMTSANNEKFNGCLLRAVKVSSA